MSEPKEATATPTGDPRPRIRVGWWFMAGIAILFLLAATLVSITLYTGYHNVELYKSLGTWGDFTGGLLNPLLTFLTFIGVLSTIVLQRIELSLTRDEMARSTSALKSQGKAIEKQNFESTFFEMLKLHNTIISAIDLIDKDTGRVTTGRDCFRVFYTRLTKIYREKEKKTYYHKNRDKLLPLSYSDFWRDAQLELGHYFRFLFNFVRFIHESPYKDGFYIKLLRSQLSDQETLLLFYNVLTPQGAKFIPYAKDYALFDNIPVVRLLNHDHALLLDREAFGDNPMVTNPRKQTSSASTGRRHVPAAAIEPSDS
jgi:hypothetical protein